MAQNKQSSKQISTKSIGATRNATNVTDSGMNRYRSRLVQIAIFVLLSLMILTVFIPAVFFHNNEFFVLVPYYTLIFLGITAFSIIKRKLFEIKMVTSEPMVVSLWILLFILVFLIRSINDGLVQLLILIAVVLFGILLMWNARREVEQQDKLSTINRVLGQANRKLQSLDAARSDFLAMASHQLRTPPATIKWYLSSLLSGDYGTMDPQVRDALQKAEITTNSLIALTDELLSASRIERGVMELYYEKTDMKDLVFKAYEQLLPLASLKKLKFEFIPPKQPIPVIIVDKQKIRQVVSNLLDNAIKYTLEGTISVSLESDGKLITVRVKDTGQGVTAAQKKVLFEKFSQGKDLITRATGLGLGLYLAKIIIGEHKGDIWVESPGAGKGSTFIFSLPIKNGAKETVSSAPIRKTSGILKK